jgi:uncharacterized protein YndB with AHSA1/START domain
MTAGDGLVLRLKRILPAPRAAAYRPLSDPRELAKWWGPRGFTAPSVEFDPRVGASYRIAISSTSRRVPRGDPPAGLAYTFRWDPPDPDDRQTVVALSLQDRGERTEVLLTQSGFATAERLALHEEGWIDSSGGWSRCSAAHRINPRISPHLPPEFGWWRRCRPGGSGGGFDQHRNEHGRARHPRVRDRRRAPAGEPLDRRRTSRRAAHLAEQRPARLLRRRIRRPATAKVDTGAARRAAPLPSKGSAHTGPPATVASDDTQSSGPGVELAPAFREKRVRAIRARPSEPDHSGDPTSTVSCGGGVPLAFLATATEAVHHRGRASPGRRLASFRGIAAPGETAWLKRILASEWTVGRRIRLRGLLRKKPWEQGFLSSRFVGREPVR